MKKLLTCLFTLLMAIAVLSPVSMKAESAAWINIELSDLDREDGLTLKKTQGKVELWNADTSYYLHNLTVSGVEGNIGRDNTWIYKNLVKFGKTSEVQDDNYSSYTVTLYDANGRYVKHWTFDGSDTDAFPTDVVVKDGYTIEISFLLDRHSAGEAYVAEEWNGDDVDDRTQPVITVVKQHAIGSSVYDSPTDASMYVVDKGDNVAKLVADGDYDNFPYYEKTLEDKEGYDYVLVYQAALTNVTEDVEVKANWVKETRNMVRFTNPLDANGDGVVTCEEAHGKGWVWDDAKGCVYTAGSTIIVNTATK